MQIIRLNLELFSCIIFMSSRKKSEDMNSQSWVGKNIGGRYEIDALLGQGGMSAVYRAYDPNLRRKVAIKLIHSHLSSDPKFISRFKEEAAAVARLRHPNIVQVHDFNIDDSSYYMVLEYLEGDTLHLVLKRLNAENRLIPIHEALNICSQLCKALGYAHSQDLIHRDIKPANVMLDPRGQAILMDFGIVKIVGGDYHTQTGATIGTATYMSPEQIRGERVDRRSDIYSLGVTLYEMLSGRPPYQAESAVSLMMNVLNRPLPKISDYRGDIPEDLRVVIEKALAKKPAQRFESMKEMDEALNRVQEQFEPVSFTPSWLSKTPVDIPAIPKAAVQPPTKAETSWGIQSDHPSIDLEVFNSTGLNTIKSSSESSSLKIPAQIFQPIAALTWNEEDTFKRLPITCTGLTLGRSSLNNIPIKDLASSRFHCKILPEGDLLTLVDLDSTNGTFLNGERVTGSKIIKPGDQIRIGEQAFQIAEKSSADADDAILAGKTELNALGSQAAPIVKPFLSWLVVISGLGSGTTFLLTKERHLVGRASRAKQWEIDLIDPFISRPHAELLFQDLRWILRDMESDNGTSINGKDLNEPVILKDGDRIGFGDTILLFRQQNNP